MLVYSPTKGRIAGGDTRAARYSDMWFKVGPILQYLGFATSILMKRRAIYPLSIRDDIQDEQGLWH